MSDISSAGGCQIINFRRAASRIRLQKELELLASIYGEAVHKSDKDVGLTSSSKDLSKLLRVITYRVAMCQFNLCFLVGPQG